MNKNIIAAILIFTVPIALYWFLSGDKSPAVLPGIAYAGPEIIKFSSPMCYECQELEKIFKEVYPEYSDKVYLHKIDVTSQDKETRKMINEYGVNLVPTCIFKNKEGKITRKTEGSIQPKILENYIKEQLNG